MARLKLRRRSCRRLYRWAASWRRRTIDMAAGERRRENLAGAIKRNPAMA